MPSEAHGPAFIDSLQLFDVWLFGTQSTVFKESYACSTFKWKTFPMWGVWKSIQIEKYSFKSPGSTYWRSKIRLSLLQSKICIERQLLFTSKTNAPPRIGRNEFEKGRRWTVIFWNALFNEPNTGFMYVCFSYFSLLREQLQKTSEF